MTDPLPPIDSLQYREVMGYYPTGVTVVTGIADDGEPVGMVVGRPRPASQSEGPTDLRLGL
jgi:flavin reductase (DIM6/NTAB) family NADH-FMN oxidoreductase RutF